MSDMLKPIEVFFSYADEDELLRNELEKHLSLLRRQGLIAGWHRRLVAVGTDWTRAVDEHLERASIILLLVSADFLASNYCYGVEMQRALQRHQTKQARVLPILLRPVNWKDAPFGHLRVLPIGGQPITAWKNQDEAFVNVVAAICQAVEDFAHPGVSSSTTTRTVLKSSAGHTALGTADVTIGRASDNTYVINDAQVSGHHAVIRPHAQGYAIFDLKSTNKTFVNGQALSPETPQMLRRGDVIRVGTTTFEYSDGILVAPVTATPEPKAPGGATPLPKTRVSASPNPVYQHPAEPMFQPPRQYTSPVVMAQQPKRSNWGLWITLIVIGVLVLSCGILGVIGLAYRIAQNPPVTASSAPITATPAPTIPQLKQFYSGTADCTNCSNAKRYDLGLSINSQDQQGNLKATISDNVGENWSCTGTVAANRSINLQCGNSTGTFVFQGTVNADGHIEGTQVFSNGVTYHDVLN